MLLQPQQRGEKTVCNLKNPFPNVFFTQHLRSGISDLRREGVLVTRKMMRLAEEHFSSSVFRQLSISLSSLRACTNFKVINIHRHQGLYMGFCLVPSSTAKPDVILMSQCFLQQSFCYHLLEVNTSMGSLLVLGPLSQ